MKRVHLIISGDVIGVGYRSWVLRLAQGKQITGWVKNREDRAVEIVAEGENLEEFIKRCHRGPQVAWVKDVKVKWEKATGEFVSFSVVY